MCHHFVQLCNHVTEHFCNSEPCQVQTIHLGSSRSTSSRADWRTELGDPESDTTDTEDEDDTVETRRFLSLMGKKPQQEKEMVNIRWQDGRVVGLPGNIKVTNTCDLTPLVSLAACLPI